MLLSAIAASLMSTAAFAGDVRIMWYSDGVEGEVLKDLLDRFMKDNPDIKVTLDNVSYIVVREQLPVQLEAGDGPDIARVTNLKALAQHWLDLRRWSPTQPIGRRISAPRPTGCAPTARTPITGFMTQITLTGGFANKTLFDQAGVADPRAKAHLGRLGGGGQEGGRQPAGAVPRWRSTAPATG